MRTIFSLIIIVMGNTLFYSQHCCLDNTFGVGGIVTTSIGMANDEAYAMKLQSDGKIVVAGIASVTAGQNFALVRYNSNGSLDNTFGTGGIVTYTSTTPSFLYDLVIQADGKIVVAGSILSSMFNNDAAIARYNTNGTLDNTFGTNGIVTTSLAASGSEEGRSVFIQSDGRYLVGGFVTSGTVTSILAIRYNTDGTLDNTFGTSGIYTVQTGVSQSSISTIIELADGKIILAGTANNSLNSDFTIVKLNHNGTIDNTFGTNGIVVTDVTTKNDYCNSLLVLTDGTMILGGEGNVTLGNNGDFAIVKYNASGGFDNSFGTNGKVILNIDYGDILMDLKMQPDGKIIAAGHAQEASSLLKIAMARFNTNGTLDQTTFGVSGIITTTVGNFSYTYEAAIQSDGKILLAGSGQPTFGAADICVQRYWYNTTGLEENKDMLTKMEVFPNPTASTLNIRGFNSSHEIIQCRIFNSLFVQVIEQKDINKNNLTIDVSSLLKGIYYAQLTDSFGNKSMARFIIN